MTDCFLQPNIRFLRAYPIVRYSALPTELHTIFKMVGAVGLEPTKALTETFTASCNCHYAILPKNGSRGRARTYNISVNSRMLYHWATLELKWLPRKDSHLHKNVNSVPCYFDTTREFKKMFTGFQRTFHLLLITSSDYNIQCLSVSIHYLLLQLLIQIRTELLLLICSCFTN